MEKIIASCFLIILFLSISAFLKAQNHLAFDSTKKASYYLQTTFGSTPTEKVPSFSIVNGVRVSRIFAFGLGLGFETHDGVKLIPIYFHFNFNLLKKRFTPVVIAEGGSGLAVGNIDSIQSVLYGSAQLGVSYYLNKKLGLILSSGWKHLNGDDTASNVLIVRGGLTF